MRLWLLAVLLAVVSTTAFPQARPIARRDATTATRSARVMLSDSATSQLRAKISNDPVLANRYRQEMQNLDRRALERRERGTAPAPDVDADPGRVYVWAESSANIQRLGSTDGVVRILDAMSTASIDTIILEVKPVHGHVIYPSRVAPRLKVWKGYRVDQDFDVIETTLREAPKRDIRVLVAINVFSEGLQESPDTRKTFGTVFDHPEWEAWNYAMPQQAPVGPAQQRNGSRATTTDTATLKPISKHGRSFATFVTPHNPEVWRYELEIIREICSKYRPDGIILDRARFDSIESDFSKYARADFETFLGRKVERWPEDILTWRRVKGKPEHVPGPLFKEWLFFRAKTIRDFFRDARDLVKSVDPKIVFGNYTGSWYGDYWNEGLNWGSPGYDASSAYSWAPPTWNEAAYAHLLDVLFSGFYYKAITPADARANGKPAENSVQGAAELVRKVVESATKVVGTINLQDYENTPTVFERAMRTSLQRSGGVGLFDLVYLDEYNWWENVLHTLATAPIRGAVGRVLPVRQARNDDNTTTGAR